MATTPLRRGTGRNTKRSARKDVSPSGADVLRYAVGCGTGAGIASILGVMLAAKLEGKSPWRPLNATSHWLQGQEAGRLAGADLPHTAVGAATNQAAAMFWGAIFGTYLANRPGLTEARMLRNAFVMAAIAGAVDYGFMPKRLTPGWELALSKRSVVARRRWSSLAATGGNRQSGTG